MRGYFVRFLLVVGNSCMKGLWLFVFLFFLKKSRICIYFRIILEFSFFRGYALCIVIGFRSRWYVLNRVRMN